MANRARRAVIRSWHHTSDWQKEGKQGWLNARPRLRVRYHMALSLNEDSEPARRFYRSAPASRFDALAITIYLFRCNAVSANCNFSSSHKVSSFPLYLKNKKMKIYCAPLLSKRYHDKDSLGLRFG